jgi:hypothetical protein
LAFTAPSTACGSRWNRTIRGPFTVGGAVWGGTHTSLASETFDLAGGGAAASAGVRSQGDRIIASADVTLAAEYMSYRQDAVTKRQLGINPGASARLLAAAGAFVVGLELRVRLPGALVQFADSDGQDLAGGFSPGAGVVVGGRW